MILIPKYEDLYPQQTLGAKFGVGGEFRCILRNSMGGVVQDTGWFHNLITDYGLVSIGTNAWWTYFHIGSSNTAPAVSDTALVSWLASDNSSAPSGNSIVNAGSPNYEGIETRGIRFDAGVGTGTIREIGLGHSSTNVNMAIRALVTPEIVKAADQVLDVYYRFTAYPDLSDTTGVVTISGIDYDYTARLGTVQNLADTMNIWEANFSISTSVLSDGTTLGSSTEDINGTLKSSSSITSTLRSSGIHEWNTYWGLDNGNTSSGYITLIRSRMDLGTSVGSDPNIKVQLAASVGGLGVPKDNTQTFNCDWRMTWARH